MKNKKKFLIIYKKFKSSKKTTNHSKIIPYKKIILTILTTGTITVSQILTTQYQILNKNFLNNKKKNKYKKKMKIYNRIIKIIYK